MSVKFSIELDDSLDLERIDLIRSRLEAMRAEGIFKSITELRAEATASAELVSEPIEPRVSHRKKKPRSVRLRSGFDRLFDRYGDAGLFSWTAGLVGAAAFMASAVGPGWVGFVVAYLPASALAAWAVADAG